MFETATPESVGISSRSILKCLKLFNERELSSHSFVLMRGDKLVCGAYWKPFDRTVMHRMYSQTKSFVGMAVLLLANEGKIRLTDPIVDYFPDKLPAQKEKLHPYLQMLTIENMLMMRTCFRIYDMNKWGYWFTGHEGDRVKNYFSATPTMYPGTQYDYDSSGSFVLGALVERVTGMTFLDYLRQKCLNAIGFSKSAYCLKCPGGYSWGDSALIALPEDMLRFVLLVGKRGRWEGKQLIDPALFDYIDAHWGSNFLDGFNTFSHRGYSCQFWRFYGNSIAFNGMHDQFTLYEKDKDIAFTCTSGNFSGSTSREIICSYLFSEIIESAGEPLPEDPEAYRELQEYCASLQLVTAHGERFSPVEKEISGKVFVPSPESIADKQNGVRFKWFTFDFGDEECAFRYSNDQGEKAIYFRRGENVLQAFPQTGYSDQVGGERCPGHTYQCAASGAWDSPNQFMLRVQIIDVYIGNVCIVLSYRDGHARLNLIGQGEDFLQEYNGFVDAVLKP